MSLLENPTDPGVIQAEQLRRNISALELPENIGLFVQELANKFGDKKACEFIENGEGLSYKQLHEQSNQVADSLNKLGAGKGDHVALLMPNSIAYLISWLGIAKLGAVVIPVNSNYTAKELDYVLSDSRACFAFVDESCLPAFEGMIQRPEVLDDGHVVLTGEHSKKDVKWVGFDKFLESGDPMFAGCADVSLQDLLQIQYTSGTTGFPKGCMQTHEYWLLAAHTAAELTADLKIENVLSVFPLFYMEAQVKFLLSLTKGGTCYLARQPSITKMMQWIRDYNIHSCTFHEVVMKGIPVSKDDAHNPLVYVNAFQYKGDNHRQLEQRFDVVGRDAFAMTETGMGTFVPIQAAHMVGSGSCGLAAPMRELKIVNEDGSEVRQGASGVLWIRGPGLFQGYFNKPEANAREFDGDWFCTGDIARQDANGYFYIVGRTKEMIKRSGENIAAREVESVLRELPQIAEAAVLPVPDEKRREEVKALLLLNKGITKDQCPPEEIFEHCFSQLAQFKVPRYIGYVEDFPRTPSNKIAKGKIMDQDADPRLNTFDRVEGTWR
ncbi:AMP-binding protein [Gammaproteobacteria bacterium]|nr:AMP-binding protein [Gammaproteobacteria bacterium]MDC1501719.1 AMP-binding protein [Gammaproteobacteria bacterium]